MKTFQFKKIVYKNLDILDLNYFQKIKKKKSYKDKLIIVKSKKTKIKIRKQKVINLISKIAMIKNKLSKFDNIMNNKNIKITEQKKIQNKIIKKILFTNGILFQNPLVKNPKEIKISFMKSLILNKNGRLFCLHLNKKLVAYFFVIISRKFINFYDINVQNSSKNGYLAIYLIMFFIKKLKPKNDIKVTTNIHQQNLKSMKFFQSLGFKKNNHFFLQTIFTS